MWEYVLNFGLVAFFFFPFIISIERLTQSLRRVREALDRSAVMRGVTGGQEQTSSLEGFTRLSERIRAHGEEARKEAEAETEAETGEEAKS